MNIPLSPSPQKPCCTPQRSGDAARSQSKTVSEAPNVYPASSASEYSASHNLVRLDGGRFLMGSEGPEAWGGDGEGPVREVTVAAFSLDAFAVTNAQFQEFVRESGYVSEAEQFGWSFVFHRHVSAQNKKVARGLSSEAQWWIGVQGACWYKPEGPGSNIKKRLEHPVVHISWNDAQAYCVWAGLRLPTEAEWEFAARGGLVQKLYPWGDELTPGGKHRCNIWQGKFPNFDSGADGFSGTAPVKSFQPNAFGFYQMSGNVWEWCADWFSPTFHRQGPRDNPTGPQAGERRVVKGGSFLCHASYCNRYRPAARTANTPDSTTSHTGFRCARSL